MSDALLCNVCGAPLNVSYLGFAVRKHDHQPDQSGLDDGPWLPGQQPRKKHAIDPASFSAARRRAWETRRAKYGPGGHS